MKKIVSLFIVLALVLFVSASAQAIGIGFEETSPAIMEDTVLFVTDDDYTNRNAVALGDLDLGSVTGQIVDEPVDAMYTQWWMIGHIDNNLVYSSLLNLNDVYLFSVEPLEGWESEPAIIETVIGTLNGFNEEPPVYSDDIYDQLITNHSSHRTGDGEFSDLWLFASPGTNIGSVGVNMHSNEIPEAGEPQPVPEPGTLLLLITLCTGLVGLGGFRKKI